MTPAERLADEFVRVYRLPMDSMNLDWLIDREIEVVRSRELATYHECLSHAMEAKQLGVPLSSVRLPDEDRQRRFREQVAAYRSLVFTCPPTPIPALHPMRAADPMAVEQIGSDSDAVFQTVTLLTVTRNPLWLRCSARLRAPFHAVLLGILSESTIRAEATRSVHDAAHANMQADLRSHILEAARLVDLQSVSEHVADRLGRREARFREMVSRNLQVDVKIHDLDAAPEEVIGSRSLPDILFRFLREIRSVQSKPIQERQSWATELKTGAAVGSKISEEHEKAVAHEFQARKDMGACQLRIHAARVPDYRSFLQSDYDDFLALTDVLHTQAQTLGVSGEVRIRLDQCVTNALHFMHHKVSDEEPSVAVLSSVNADGDLCEFNWINWLSAATKLAHWRHALKRFNALSTPDPDVEAFTQAHLLRHLNKQITLVRSAIQERIELLVTTNRQFLREWNEILTKGLRCVTDLFDHSVARTLEQARGQVLEHPPILRWFRPGARLSNDEQTRASAWILARTDNSLRTVREQRLRLPFAARDETLERLLLSVMPPAGRMVSCDGHFRALRNVFLLTYLASSSSTTLDRR